MAETFAEVLGQFLGRMEYSAGQLAKLSGVPKKTIVNWLAGRVRRPHQWQQIVRVADALHLTEAEADRLLQAARWETLQIWRSQVAGQLEEALFSRWPLPAAAPFQAKMDIPYFIRREEKYFQLEERLRRGEFVTIYSFQGMGGVGKTALANHLAHKLRAAFPDGILWSNLHNSDSMSILSGFAAAYGEDVSHLQDLESRAAAVRALLATKKALIILDNAQNSAQVRPLLPANTGKTAVIVTTRRELEISDKMHRVEVTPFSAHGEEALHVFTHFLSASTVRRWRQELGQIADILGHLPLAIALAAGQMASRNSVTEYLARLKMIDQRLDALIREDRSVRISFLLSFEQLTEPLQNFYAALGSLAAADFSLPAAAAIAEVSEPEAASALNELAQYSLLMAEANERYSRHTLLRDFAREYQTDLRFDQRMVTYFAHYAFNFRVDTASIRQEQAHITEAIQQAESNGWGTHYNQAVLGLFPLLLTSGNGRLAIEYLEKGIKRSENNQPDADLTRMYSNAGSAYWRLGQLELAAERFETGLELAKRLELTELIPAFLINLSSVMASQGNKEMARRWLEEAYSLLGELENPYLKLQTAFNLGALAYEEGDWPASEGYFTMGLALADTQQGVGLEPIQAAYNNLAVLKYAQGKYEEAKGYAHKSLAISQQLEDPNGTSLTLAELALLAMEEDDLTLADKSLAESLTLADETQHPEPMIRARIYQGLLAARQGKSKEAEQWVQEALQMARKFNIVWNVADALLELGTLSLKTGAWAAAQNCFEEALEIGTQLDAPEVKGVANFGLAQVQQQKGEINQAKQLAQVSLVLLQPLGHRQVKIVEGWLRSID